MRAQVKQQSVSSKVLEPRIGYLQISRFVEATGADVAAALTELRTKNALGVLVLATVLRLRRKRRRGGESKAGSDDHDASNRADSRAHAGGTG